MSDDKKLPAPTSDKPFDMPPEGSPFEARGGWVMRRLLEDLTPLKDFQAGGVVGNLGGESGLDPNVNEAKPMIPGSRGGFGWEQATGPRRVGLEKWAADHGIDFGPSNPFDDDEANYGFLIHELRTTEARALRDLRNTKNLHDAVAVFMMTFERPSVQSEREVQRRMEWARRAMTGYARLTEGAAPASAPPVRDPLIVIASIKVLQAALIPYGYAGKIDGDWGRQSEAAMAEFRRSQR